ncbi:SGNH/GDSL hydrolase family protein [Herbiconiux sp. CPCC 205716]|uniref:SGNH/GDSL hydrolase family protein n=1 Tax=Herbiconiux gentiana TaxID=2970912 RepID=A0ABT2GDT5_9MICO|nr:SGNH/GDSL hydrolase family protein [Herbiconiux gentiana]MCS5714261.1 SGNH/GDSL hydrolase family protein [Herbiconiux gentiana]
MPAPPPATDETLPLANEGGYRERVPEPRLRRIVAAAAALPLVVVSLALGAQMASATDVGGASDPVQYVALGDSYSAGFGLVPFSDEPAAGCYQAVANYPHLVADALGLALTDRTCSGAVTANIRDTPQTTITGAGVAPVQSDALTADTDVVTVTIGGNDLGFSTVATSCLAQSAQGPLFAVDLPNCRALYVQGSGEFEFDTLKAKLDDTVAPALAQTFALIAAKAPNAKVIVVGYPSIAPDVENVPVGGCFTPLITGQGAFPENAFPFTDVDTGYLHETEARLDAAIRTAAEGAGASYVSTLAATESHSACSTSDPYINGVTLTAGEGTASGVEGLSVKLGVLHPNTAGVGFLATEVGAAVAAAIEPTQPSPSPTPPPAPTPSPGSSAPASPAPGAVPAAPGTGPGADPAHPALAATGTDPLPLLLAALAVLAAGALAAAAATRRPHPRA